MAFSQFGIYAEINPYGQRLEKLQQLLLFNATPPAGVIPIV